jgi:hypothetical protein
MSVSDRFARYVECCPMSGCWLWSGAPNRQGYGRLLVAGRAVKAHRLSYEMHKGAIPDGMSVLHRCDTPACVNPAHLFVGSQVANIADMDAKGRRRFGHIAPRGSASPRAILSEDVVLDLRRRKASGETLNQTEIAKAMGVAVSCVSRAVNGVTWKHLADGEGSEPARRGGRQ